MSKKAEKNSAINKEISLDTFIKYLTIISIPLTMIADIIAIVSAAKMQAPFAFYIAIPLMIISFSLVIYYIVKKILDTDKAKQYLEICYLKTSSSAAEKMHTHFHRFRNIVESTGTRDTVTREYVKQAATQICDALSAFFSALLRDYLDKNQVSVCIKLIDPQTMNEEDTEHWLLETLARSVSTNQARSNMDRNKVLVSDNSDFSVILSNDFDCPYFACPDMRDIEDFFIKNFKKEYRNSRSNYIKHYKSTIVMPIKIDGQNVSREIKEKDPTITERSVYFGFLCIDSLKVFSTTQEVKAFETAVEYAKGFADSLFIYLEKVSSVKQKVLTQNE